MQSLADALRLTRGSVVAFVGAGGKTAALAAVSRSCTPCYAAATGHFGQWQAAFADCHAIWRVADGGALPHVRDAGGIVLLTGEPDEPPSRLRGISRDQAVALCEEARRRGCPVFFEADGSRCRPLKAPADHEPPVPPSVNLVVIVAGLSGLGRPLDDTNVHRPERFAALAGCRPGTILTPELVARVLLHSEGGLKNVPPCARRIVLLNQADTPELRVAAAAIAEHVLQHVDAAVVASLAPGGTRHPQGPGLVFAVFER